MAEQTPPHQEKFDISVIDEINYLVVVRHTGSYRDIDPLSEQQHHPRQSLAHHPTVTEINELLFDLRRSGMARSIPEVFPATLWNLS